MRNLELKFRHAELEEAHRLALELGAREVARLYQEDTFFSATTGRLKLRDFGDGHGELIAYRRPDTTEVRSSEYSIYPTTEPAVLRDVLAEALGTVGTICKERLLLLYGHTRIHLDQVEGLGSFVELETVLSGQPETEAEAELATVVTALRLNDGDRIAGAYLDLLRSAAMD